MGSGLVTVSVEYRFQVTPDGMFWAKEAFGWNFWQRYLVAFDRVRILARALPVPEAQHGWTPATGDRVEGLALPHYIGSWGYIRRLRAIKRVLDRVSAEETSFILRLPSPVGSLLAKRLRQQHRGYAVEVVGDPIDAFSPGAIQHWLRPYFQRRLAADLRRDCSGASAAAYVTKEALQRRYPPAEDAQTSWYSSVILPPEAFVDSARQSPDSLDSPRLLVVASLEQPYKGIDVLLHALPALRQSHPGVGLIIVGDGRLRQSLQDLAFRLGIQDLVHFVGGLPAGAAVRAVMDAADLLIIPSRTEGLPRVVIEAMARGLPVIGTRVGGIPELLQEPELVPSGDHVALAHAIIGLCRDRDRYDRLCRDNLEIAHHFSDAVLSERRSAFYQQVRAVSSGGPCV